jgi:uncharacterized membrane protein YcaP (DUF421 family)
MRRVRLRVEHGEDHAARLGGERIDEIKHAVLERSGAISVVVNADDDDAMTGALVIRRRQ